MLEPLHHCGYSLEQLQQAVLTSTHNLYFEQKYEKYQSFYLKTFSFQFLVLKFSIYLKRFVFVLKLNFPPFWNGYYFKRKEIAPRGGANSFLSRPLFRKGMVRRVANRKLQKTSPLKKTVNQGRVSDLLSLYAHHFSLIRIFTARVQEIMIL